MRIALLAICTLALACSIQLALSEDDYLDPGNAGASQAARDEIGSTMQSDIFNVGSQSGMGTTTPQSSRASPGSVRLGGSQASPFAVSSQAGQAPVAQSQAQIQANAAGNWRLEMRDRATRSAVLELRQSGDAVFGRGILTTGNNTQEIAASGSALGSTLLLDLVSISDPSLFRMALEIDASGSASGSYNIFSSTSAAVSGSVSGRLTA